MIWHITSIIYIFTENSECPEKITVNLSSTDIDMLTSMVSSEHIPVRASTSTNITSVDTIDVMLPGEASASQAIYVQVKGWSSKLHLSYIYMY